MFFVYFHRCTQKQQQQQQPPRRLVVAHGILDAYRRDKGLPLPTPQQQQGAGGSNTSLLEKASQGLTGVSEHQVGRPYCIRMLATRVSR